MGQSPATWKKFSFYHAIIKLSLIQEKRGRNYSGHPKNSLIKAWKRKRRRTSSSRKLGKCKTSTPSHKKKEKLSITCQLRRNQGRRVTRFHRKDAGRVKGGRLPPERVCLRVGTDPWPGGGEPSLSRKEKKAPSQA